MTDTGRLPVASPAAVRAATRELLSHERGSVAGVVVTHCAAALVGLVAPWLLGRIVDNVTGGGSVSTVDLLAAAIVGAVFAQILLVRHARLLAARLGERVLARLRERFVDRSLLIPLPIVERAGVGDLMTRASVDVGAVGSSVRGAVPEMALAGVQVVFIIAAVFIVDPLLGVVAFTGVPILVLATRWYLRRARTAYIEEGASISEVSESMAATVTGARTVETLRLRAQRVHDSETHIDRSFAARMATLRLRTVFFPAVDVAHAVPTAVVLLVGGLLYFDRQVTLGAVVSAALYLWQLVDPLEAVFTWVEQLQRGAASLARVEGIGGVIGRPTPTETGPEPSDDRLELRGARFRYDPGGPEVLRGIDLTVRPGERLAIVGPSGAGKSTIARLLAGIDPPTDGAVLLGGVSVTDVDANRLRRLVVLLTQEHHVFAAPLRDNLRLAEPDADDASLWSVLDTVSAEWAHDLPDGLDTVLGGNGVSLPDAAEQQLALARVILADPRVLVLDEATARLDPSTARGTERALARVLAGRTVVSIAHRLHTARDADRIAVVEDGRITELGSHDELLTAGGAYAALWRSWHG
ncbi:ABC transporter ATP-binding protein [Stackebrandtia soli]|uniref:ABC transporter ATP-binding protein n=1 Tax=Stackebrandtia soli TaxID=1892856 RepID=UPI0039E8C128